MVHESMSYFESFSIYFLLKFKSIFSLNINLLVWNIWIPLVPNISESWHIDEMFVKMKG